jgi:hypothetical protein
MKTVNRSEIESEELVCPYCMDTVSFERTGCCGESRAHFARAYIVQDEAFLESELCIIDDEEEIEIKIL